MWRLSAKTLRWDGKGFIFGWRWKFLTVCVRVARCLVNRALMNCEIFNLALSCRVCEWILSCYYTNLLRLLRFALLRTCFVISVRLFSFVQLFYNILKSSSQLFGCSFVTFFWKFLNLADWIFILLFCVCFCYKFTIFICADWLTIFLSYETLLFLCCQCFKFGVSLNFFLHRFRTCTNFRQG